MKRALPAFLTLLLLLALMSNPLLAYGQEPRNDSDQTASGEAEDDAPVQRVARLSLVQGDVSFLRAGVKEWAAAVENLPLLAGDQLYAGSGARAELQLGRGNYIRLSENTALTITELADAESQFEITEGIAIIRIERLQTAFGRFEVDTPNAALVLEQDGLYRVNVRGDNDSEVIVRRGAAEVSTVDGSFKVREGHKLLVDSSATGRLEIALDDSRDDWDQWSFDRDVAIDRSGTSLAPDYVNDYETTYNGLYGVSDLSSYGAWTTDSSYGYCWRPRVDNSWVPYRDGQWLWVPGTGWTWLSHEPWGWAPYHYGRWAYSTALGWVWIPGFGSRYPNYSRGYYRWRPALVSFFYCPTSRGHYVGWYPLAPGERWRNSNRRGGDHAHLNYPNARDGWRRPDDGRAGIRPPRDSRGVSLIPVDGFTRPDRSRVRPVTPDKDLRDWIGRGVRPGLPDITPTPVASAPSFREGGERRYRIAIPPGEIIKRPVVTRNRPADSQAGVSAPRERRLIVPRNPAVSLDPSDRKERGHGQNEDRRPRTPAVNPGEGQDKDESNRVVRTPRPLPADRVNDDNRRSERRNKRDGEDPSSQRPADKSKDSAGENNSAEERERKQPIYLPTPKKDDSSGEEPAKNEERRHERRQRDEERARPREEAPAREDHQRRSEDRPKPRDNEQPAPRAERPQPPRSETREQPREERQQQKQERQQERREEREQRKKP
ncbi:MAG TPA: DUF6600 domain-containing protein [Blastocatellia bacterium]|nr:DUF6600 domain-containing protein [Blastocatellia bacterium]